MSSTLSSAKRVHLPIKYTSSTNLMQIFGRSGHFPPRFHKQLQTVTEEIFEGAFRVQQQLVEGLIALGR